MEHNIESIRNKIYEIRGQRVMLDRDLAELYGVTTGNLNKAVKRNIRRFPCDFMFQLTKEEWDSLRFQIGILEVGRGKYTKFLPHAFTEQGLAMLSGVLNSDIAIDVNISIMRAFVSLRRVAAVVRKGDLLEILKRNSIGPLASYNQKMMMIRNKSVLSRYNIIDQYAFEKNIGELQKGTPL